MQTFDKNGQPVPMPEPEADGVPQESLGDSVIKGDTSLKEAPKVEVQPTVNVQEQSVPVSTPQPTIPAGMPMPPMGYQPQQPQQVVQPVQPVPQFQQQPVQGTFMPPVQPMSVPYSQPVAQATDPRHQPPEPPLPRSGEQSGSSPKKGGFSASTFFAAIATSAVVSAGVTLGGVSLANNNGTTPGGNSQITTILDDLQDVDNDATLATGVAKIAKPSVVCIYSYTNQKQMSYSDIFSMFMDGGDSASVQEEDEGEPQLLGLGSGVIISNDGYIVTNAHVVEQATSVRVSHGGEEFDGEIVGIDSSTDLAVVKIEAEGLKAIEAADADKLEVGDWTMAIGAPYGYEETCTTGIVSALARATAMQDSDGTITYYPNLIQTDASINSGNSGGALVNREGKLIGINTLITSPSGTSAGVGFAIPSNYALNVAHQIIESGEVKHASLGVVVTLEDGVDGAVIKEIVSGGSAEQGGLKVGDAIISIDGEKVTTPSNVVYDVRKHFVGDEIEIVYVRDGAENTVKITLGDDAAAQAAEKAKKDIAQNQSQSQNQSQPYSGQRPYDNGGSNKDMDDTSDGIDELFKYFLNQHR